MEATENEILPEKKHENNLMLNTIEILDDEKQNILTEILKCVVCLELPVGKQVRICEKGHHFCHTCHKNMKACGVCRGLLLDSRNFVVEDLMTKLGPVLSTSKYKLPPASTPCNLSQGLFKCPHNCSIKVQAGFMLSHLRDHHSANLVDNVRSNPYSGRFSFTYNIELTSDDKFIWSLQVSDMGLFTVELSFVDFNVLGWVRMLADKTIASMFRYQLVLKIPKAQSESFVEFSVSNLTVSSYLEESDSVELENNSLKIKKENLLEHINVGSKMTVFFSVWRKNEKVTEESNELIPSVVCLPEKCLYFKSDRKVRRNRNRNARRKRIKEKFRNANESGEMSQEFTRLTL